MAIGILESDDKVRLGPLHPMVRNLVSSVAATLLEATATNYKRVSLVP